jgi:hypothetical protein
LINQREDFSFALFSGGLMKARLYCIYLLYIITTLMKNAILIFPRLKKDHFCNSPS